MDAPAPAHLKEMYKLIRHVLSTKGYGLKFELRKDIIKWALKALSDSDFASDKETRISVFGIKFVQSEENEADILTKNTTNVIFNNHQKKLVWDKANVESELIQELDQSENQQEGC